MGYLCTDSIDMSRPEGVSYSLKMWNTMITLGADIKDIGVEDRGHGMERAYTVVENK